MAKCTNCIHHFVCKNIKGKLENSYAETCVAYLNRENFVAVVHGRWVGHYDMSWIHKQKWLTGYDCSVCGRFIKTMTPYCPNCGAKMDGESSDNG